ncbi:LAFA_0D15962g1_1 [Lachancea sp. 'fantastica']|nr:LAFA_0D15962g1_1 [Lachancea sp. 'fantastica']
MTYQMTSLDDSVLIHQNMMLLENVTNLERPAIDYYHCDITWNDPLAMPQTWNVLLHLGKYKLLRLPSCSAENETDYQMYVKRLHHCLWRRWSISYYGLAGNKVDPSAVNWNKEQDFTVLYGPDLTLDEDTSVKSQRNAIHHENNDGQNFAMQPKFPLPLVSKNAADDELDDSAGCFSSSLESRDSSIFDHIPSKSCMKHSDSCHRGRRRPLQFNDQVRRRDIDPFGSLYEHNILLNDSQMPFPGDNESEFESEPEHVQYSIETWDSDSDLDLDFV